MTFSQFIEARHHEAYPEERSTGHNEITNLMAGIVAPLLPAGGNVLDVGCGKGPALEWFKNAGFDVTGTSVVGQDIADCAAQGFHPVYPCDMHATAETFDAESFDLVWARHVLEHSLAPFFVLHQFAQVLRPSGILYVEVPAPDTSCRHESNPNHYSVMGLEMWKNLIHIAGFELVEIRDFQLKTGAGPDVYWSFIGRKK